jgi:hypothetical protein
MKKKGIAMEADTSRSMDLFEGLLLLVVMVSMVSIVLLMFGAFKSLNALSIGVILVIVVYILFGFKMRMSIPELNWIILLILLVALSFRIKPYLTVLGGSDEGIYMSMSSTYERTGSTIIIDNLREKMDATEEMFYDRVNNHILPVVKGRFEGNHLPGVDISDINKSEYVFQFYPLHPIWMAITAKLFGCSHRAYSLVFFSLLSVFAFYLLAFEISGGRQLPGLIVASFLAVHPLHVFFSKFPTTEVIVLAFSSTSLYFLVKYYRESENNHIRPFYLFISSGLMFCLFFTHMRGFLYVPFLYLLLLLTIIVVKEERPRRHLIAYFVAVMFLFSFSLFYGYHYTFPYFRAEYKHFLKIDNLSILFFIIVISLLLSAILNLFRNGVKYKMENILTFLNNYIGALLIAVIIGGFITAVLLGYTTILNNKGYTWLAGKGLASLRVSTISYIIFYLSPIGFVLFLFAVIYQSRKKDTYLTSLFLFLILVWSAIIYAYPGLPDYVRARYLLVEILPYSLLLISLFLSGLFEKGRIYRTISLSCIGVMLLYFVSFSCYQFQGKIKDADEMHLAKVQEQVNRGDLLLLCYHPPLISQFIQTPLSYYYGLTTIRVTNLEESLADLSHLINNDFKRVFLLSDHRINDETFFPCGVIPFKVFSYAVDIVPFKKVLWINSKLYLYEIDKRRLYSMKGMPARSRKLQSAR